MAADDLDRQLESAPLTEVIGVVSASGVSGASGWPDRDRWTLLLSFSGWKEPGGPLQKSELTVRKEVSEGELARFQDAVGPFDVLRIEVRLARENVRGSPQALLIKSLGKDATDPELLAYAIQLQEPVTFKDSQFGLFTLDRRIDWYAAVTDWGGTRVRLTIPAAEAADALTVARGLWAAQAEWQRRITDYAIKYLLDLKNDAWLQEGEAEVDAKEFAKRMALETISIEADGSFEFWYGDGELFWGHSIKVGGNLAAGPNDAGIHG
jgi:hypothetical protein